MLHEAADLDLACSDQGDQGGGVDELTSLAAAPQFPEAALSAPGLLCLRMDNLAHLPLSTHGAGRASREYDLAVRGTARSPLARASSCMRLASRHTTASRGIAVIVVVVVLLWRAVVHPRRTREVDG